MTLSIKRNYEGSYTIKGHNRDYEITIERSCDDPKVWRCEDLYFSRLSEAKEYMFQELSQEAV